MTEEEKQRMHNLEVAVMVLLDQVTKGGYRVEDLQYEFYNAARNKGALQDMDILPVPRSTL